MSKNLHGVGVARRIRFLGPLFMVLGLGIVACGIFLQWRLSQLAGQPQGVAYIGEEKHLVNSMQAAAVGILNANDGKSPADRLIELEHAYTEWRSIHHRLETLAAKTELDPKVSSELKERVFPRYERLVSAVETLFSFTGTEINPEKLKPLVMQIDEETEYYLFLLDHLDLHLGNVASQKIGNLQTFEAGLILVAGFLLLLLFYWLYRPASRALTQYNEEVRSLVEELRDKNTLLSEMYFKVERKASSITDCLNTLAHEIRNSLATVNLSTELLREVEAPSEEVSTAVSLIEKNSNLALQTLEKFLEMTRVEGGMEKLEVERVLLSSVVESVAQEFHRRALHRRLKFNVEIDPACPEYISTDSHKLGRVLENLLSNAFKYTDKGSVGLRVHPIKARKFDPPKLCIEVSDTGIGVAADQLDNLFKPFSTPNKRKDSIGLGLAIARRLVEGMSGEIYVRSTVGKGTTFIVEIPQELSKGDGIETADRLVSTERHEDIRTALKANHNLKRLNILLLEDSKELRELTARFLLSVGVSVKAYGTADEALHYLESLGKIPFDLMLVDLNLPGGMDGLGFARRVRELGMEGPLIALTSYSVTYSRSKCLAEGFADFVEKPLTSLSLANIIVRHISNKDGIELGRAPSPEGENLMMILG